MPKTHTKRLDKCPKCGASRYKNNDLYNGGEATTSKKRKKGGKKDGTRFATYGGDSIK
jgi:hypothetical protein